MIAFVKYTDKKNKEPGLNGASSEDFCRLDPLRRITVFTSNQYLDRNIVNMV